MKFLKAPFKFLFKLVKKMSWPQRIGAAILLIALFSFVAIEVTGQPGFCNSCHVMNPYYDNWKTSSHNEVNCLKCHIPPGIINYAKGKITGLAQAVDCIVGRIGTKPNAKVLDESCLRSGCHTTEALVSKEVKFNSVKFNHEKHISKVVDGIAISCGTCHNHFEGNEHFNVNKQVCFTCHFLGDKQTGERLVKTTCTSCHDVPDKVIERGLVKVNHTEFASYQANCDDSCHKKQIQQKSNVPRTVCLNCHSEAMDDNADSEHLHEIHSEGEKVECFSCHGDISHAYGETTSLASMMSCQNCHSDTHAAQRGIFAAEQHIDTKDERVLSPMYLTHVGCPDCHIEQTEAAPGVLDSFGKVARAVPRACDRCHEPGTGEMYIPLWQKGIQQKYSRISEKLDAVKLQFQYDQQEDIPENIAQAEGILMSVESDGSWGVHNLKYTEAMLVKANELLDNLEKE